MKVSQRRQTNTRSPPAIYMVEQSARQDLLDLMARTWCRYCMAHIRVARKAPLVILAGLSKCFSNVVTS